jgi:hypothetical protein
MRNTDFQDRHNGLTNGSVLWKHSSKTIRWIVES